MNLLMAQSSNVVIMFSEENLLSIVDVLKELSDTRGVPRNVKAVIDDAVKSIRDSKESPSARVNTAITILDEISNDPNLPGHLRTQIWNVVSMLESLQSQLQ